MKEVKKLLLAAVLLLCLAGCGTTRTEPITPTTPNTHLPSVMYDDTLYLSTFKQIPGEVDSSAIIGNISSTVPLSQLPTENGQANFDALDAPYALTDEGLAVLVDSEWILFSTDGSGNSVHDDGPSGPNDVVILTFPDEPSPSVPWYSIGVDAGWGWEQKDLSADKIYAMFGQENELLFADAAVEALHDLTAEGFFDAEGVAQSMTVQGWREYSPEDSGPNHPIFQINLFQLDSRLMRTKAGEDAVVAENEVFGVPVTTCRREVKNADCYYAAFETNGLAVGCTVYTSASQSAEDAKELLSRIVSQCLAPDGGIRLDAANGETGYTPMDSWPQTELLSHIPEPTEGQPIRFHAFPDDYEVVELEGCTSETYEQYISMLQQEGFSAWDGDWGNDASRWDKDGYSVQVSLYNGHMIIAVSTDGLEE